MRFLISKESTAQWRIRRTTIAEEVCMPTQLNAATRCLILVLVSALPGAGAETAQTAVDQVGDALAAINPTAEGAESLVQGSISTVDRRARPVLTNMGLELTKTDYEDDATEREYEARNGNRVVHVKLEARGATSTQVNVSSREGTLDYDKSHARRIRERIQRQRLAGSGTDTGGGFTAAPSLMHRHYSAVIR